MLQGRDGPAQAPAEGVFILSGPGAERRAGVLDVRPTSGARRATQPGPPRSPALATPETATEMAAAAATAPVPRPTVEIVDRRVISSLVPSDAVHQGFASLTHPAWIRPRISHNTGAGDGRGYLHCPRSRHRSAERRSGLTFGARVRGERRRASGSACSGRERPAGESGLGRPGSRAVDPRHQSSTHIAGLAGGGIPLHRISPATHRWSWLRCRCKAIWRSYSAPKARG